MKYNIVWEGGILPLPSAKKNASDIFVASGGSISVVSPLPPDRHQRHQWQILRRAYRLFAQECAAAK